MERRRPFGVTAIAIILLINAIVAVARFYAGNQDIRTLLAESSYLVLINLALSLVGPVIGVGLWRLGRGAWVAAMIWAGAHLTSSLISYFHDEPHYLSMLLAVIAVFYLNQRDVQAAFQAETGDEERAGD